MPTQATDLTSEQISQLNKQYFEGAGLNYVTVHDPSVVIGYEQTDGTVTGEATEGSKKIYCIFGSHRAWAKSYDLQNWEYFTNNLSTQYATVFATDAIWSKNGSSSYNVSGNMWAPDVVWNKKMNKWCMYMSINGDNWFSSIVLLTAESLTGNWTRVGTVVYSGFTAATYTQTDLLDVTGESAFPSRYVLNRNGNRTYGLNAIDPCTFYDEEGNLWMTYGSWFGGLYMLRLDEETGLRDKNYTYTTNNGTVENAVSDAYQGIKIAGGAHVSGEASYIEYIDGAYYLFVTYGGLTATGGYNMRVFNSTNVTGPYYDLAGHDARYLTSGTTNSTSINNTNCAGTTNGAVGTRLMSYYRWSFMDYGYTAQGHNSAVVDTDGKKFLVYHTRFDDGTEGHQVRVHQLFTAQNGGLVCAPFEYRGETLSAEGYTANDIVGTYGILLHGRGTDYAKLTTIKEKQIVLEADGTISGNYQGTWTLNDDKLHINVTISGTKYQGILIEQNIEGTNYKTLCFGAVSDTDMSVWGYKKYADGQIFPDDISVAYNVANATSALPNDVYSGNTIQLSAEGLLGATYTWTPTDTTVISSSGVVADVENNTTTEIEQTISCGDASYTIKKTINVHAALPLPIPDEYIVATYANNTEFEAETNSRTQITEKTGVSISFTVSGLASDWDLVANSTDSKYKMYLSVLHYNASSEYDIYEAKATTSAEAKAIMADENIGAWQLLLNGNYFVTISYNPDGSIEYYRDGVLMLTYPATTTASWSAGTSTNNTAASLCSAAIQYFQKNQIRFARTVSNVVVGYSAHPDLSTDATPEVEAQPLRASTDNNSLIISGKAESDIVCIYDVKGCKIYSGKKSVIDLPRGLYLVVVGNTSTKVLVK